MHQVPGLIYKSNDEEEWLLSMSVTLFCLPYAGGSSMAYAKWPALLKGVEVVSLELAGKGQRISEVPYESMEEAIADLYPRMLPKLDGAYAMFGHSMGALVAYELSRKLTKEGHPAPQHMFFSGRRAPQCPLSDRIIHQLPESEFRQVLQRLGGTPRELFDNEELAELFLPIIRKDYQLLETYRFQRDGYTLNCSITVMNGNHDDIPLPYLEAWRELSSGSFQRLEFEGGHFFIHEQIRRVVHAINTILYPAMLLAQSAHDAMKLRQDFAGGL